MKKKTRILLIVLAIILVLAAAAAVIVLRMNRGSRTPIDNNPEPAVSGNSNVLVAYFSWSGHGRQMANWVAEETGGELFRIVPEVPYGDDFDTVANRAQTELNDSTRQALSAHIDPEIMAKYDTVYLGFPIWWYDLPTPLWSFLEEYDLSGKTIIPFFSHAGSSNGANSLNRLASLAAGATVLTNDALSINGDRVNDSETPVKSWAVSVVHK